MATPRRTTRITAGQAHVDAALARARSEFETKCAAQLDAAMTKARTAGATAERARIKAVLEQELPGHEKTIYHLAFFTAASPGAAAMAVIAAERLRHAVAAQVERELADAADRFAEDQRAREIGRRAQDYCDRQFATGVEVSIDAAIAHIMAEDAAK